MINITLVGFFGGVSLNAVKSFIKYVFSYFKINANKDGAIIIVDRQSNKAVLTTDGINYKNVNGVENYVKEHHQTEGKGGYIYYTYVVDNMKKITDKNKVKQFAHNTYAKIRNSILTKFGKSFGNLKLNRIMNKNQISQITQDNDVIGRFLNDNGKIDDAESYLLTVPNATSEQLLLIGTDICNSFHQTSVVIEDLNKNLCYFANGKKLKGKNYQEKVANAKRNINEFEPYLNKSNKPYGTPNENIGTVKECFCLKNQSRYAKLFGFKINKK